SPTLPIKTGCTLRAQAGCKLQNNCWDGVLGIIHFLWPWYIPLQAPGTIQLFNALQGGLRKFFKWSMSKTRLLSFQENSCRSKELSPNFWHASLKQGSQTWNDKMRGEQRQPSAQESDVVPSADKISYL
ncbi:hypothetical protein Celaphus_00001847, partial [Cervus elaphus hippelaphus]